MSREETGMTMVIKTSAVFISCLIFIFGAYIILKGHGVPGGGFAGGVVVALGFVNLLMIFGRYSYIGRVFRRVAYNLEIVSVFLLFLFATAGFFAGNVYTWMKAGLGVSAILLPIVIWERTRKE